MEQRLIDANDEYINKRVTNVPQPKQVPHAPERQGRMEFFEEIDAEQVNEYKLHFTATIDPEAVKKVVDQAIIRHVNTEVRKAEIYERGAITLAIKDMIYSQKNEIIERVIERASREIVKKGLPKLMDKFND